MNSHGRPILSRDKAHHFRPAVVIVTVVMAIPRPAYLRVILCIAVRTAKNQIAAGHQLVPVLRQLRVLGGLIRLPILKERQHRPGGLCIYPGQQFFVQSPASCEALRRTLRFTLCVHSKYVARVVTEEICSHAGSALYRRRQRHCLRRRYSLFSTLLLSLD